MVPADSGISIQVQTCFFADWLDTLNLHHLKNKIILILVIKKSIASHVFLILKKGGEK